MNVNYDNVLAHQWPVCDMNPRFGGDIVVSIVPCQFDSAMW